MTRMLLRLLPLLVLLAACSRHEVRPDDPSPPVEKQEEAPPAMTRVPADTDTTLPPTPSETLPPATPPVAASPAQEAKVKPCGHEKLVDEPKLDLTKRKLQETVCSTALWFDGLFGDQDRHDIAVARGSSGRVELSFAYSEFYGFNFRPRFSARMKLPNLEERWSAFIGRDAEDTFVRDRSEAFSLRTRFPRLEDRDETIAGLGYSLPSAYKIKTEFRSGIRFAGLRAPKLFAQVRLAYNAYSDDTNLIDLRATPFVNTNDGFGLTNSVDMSHVLSERKLIRWSNVATISQKTAGMDWRSAVILYQGLPSKSAIAYETFVRGATALPVPLAEYGAQATYRRPLSKERLYGSLMMGYTFPQDDPLLEREGSYQTAFILEMPFGEQN